MNPSELSVHSQRLELERQLRHASLGAEVAAIRGQQRAERHALRRRRIATLRVTLRVKLRAAPRRTAKPDAVVTGPAT